jgi:hypothetical protein
MPGVTIDESRAAHIFRDADGHFREDNAVNGTQVWAQVRGDMITNGGVNRTPRVFHFS